MTEAIKNPDRPPSTVRGSSGVTAQTISDRSADIISRFPISTRPPNGRKLIQVDGRYYTAAEYAKSVAGNSPKAPETGIWPEAPRPVNPPLTTEPTGDGVNPGPDASLSLLRNNSTETPQTDPPKVQKATPRGLNSAHRKSKNALQENVAYMVDLYGIENVGFLTLTFADHVLDAREASRRFNSLSTHVLSERYAAYIRVLERQKSGRIHYHLLVALPDDIRTGFDFEAVKNQDYRSANKSLRLEWAFWRKTAPAYRFGRTELMPIKSTGRGLAQYVGKYISKHIGARAPEDKGVRLVSYGGNSRNWTAKHTPLDYPSTQWRYKCETFARQVKASRGKLVNGMDDLARIMGKNWAFKHREYIISLPPTAPDCPF